MKYSKVSDEEEEDYFQDQPKWTLKRRIVQFVLEFAVLCAFAVVYSYIFILPLCGFLFRCGCTWTWNGGSSRCNARNPTGPHCPWCIAPKWIAWLPQWGGCIMIVLAALLVRIFWLRRFSAKHTTLPNIVLRFVVMLFVGVIAFYLFGLFHGFIFKEVYDYPYFL